MWEIDVTSSVPDSSGIACAEFTSVYRDVYKKCVLDTPECFQALELTFFSNPHYSTTIHSIILS